LLDLAVAHLDQDARVLSFQESAGNSAGPEVDAFTRVLGHLSVDDDVGQLQTAARTKDTVDFAEHRSLSGIRSITPLEITTSTDASSSGSVSTSDSCSSTLASPISRALEPARSSIADVMSTPMTRPSGPTICAAISRSVPAPQPRSSTTEPVSTCPNLQWFATPAKLSTVASGTRDSSGSG
jgi:hypothetical protein